MTNQRIVHRVKSPDIFIFPYQLYAYDQGVYKGENLEVRFLDMIILLTYHNTYLRLESV